MIYLPKEIVEILENITFDVYLRRSSKDNEDKQIRSIPEQWRDINNQLIKPYNIKVGKVFKEKRSAFKVGRPSFGEFIERVTTGKSQGGISWHSNRIARNYKDGGDFVQLMSDGKLKLFLTCQGLYMNSARDKEYLMTEFTRATRDSDDKSEAVKRGYRGKIKRGYIPSGRLPEGYRHVKDIKTEEMFNEPDRESFDKQKTVKKHWHCVFSSFFGNRRCKNC